MQSEISCKPSRKMTTDSKTVLAGFQSDSTELKYSRWGNEDVGDSEEWGEPTAPRPLVKITLKAIAVRLWGTNVKLVLYIFAYKSDVVNSFTVLGRMRQFSLSLFLIESSLVLWLRWVSSASDWLLL